MLTPEVSLTQAPKSQKQKAVVPSRVLAAMHATLDQAAEAIMAAGVHGRIDLYWDQYGVDLHIIRREGKRSLKYKDLPE